MDIGRRMKELRVQYGLTQQELADRAELTKGFISQLERNQNSPSVGTLLDIIQCLGLTPAEFFTDSQPKQIVYNQNDYFEKIDNEKSSTIEWIVPDAQANSMEPIRLTLAPGGSSEVILPRECEEFGYVLKGTVKLNYGGTVQIVKAGESFYFRADKRHFIENTSSKEAVLIWVSTPPSF